MRNLKRVLRMVGYGCLAGAVGIAMSLSFSMFASLYPLTGEQIPDHRSLFHLAFLLMLIGVRAIIVANSLDDLINGTLRNDLKEAWQKLGE